MLVTHNLSCIYCSGEEKEGSKMYHNHIVLAVVVASPPLLPRGVIRALCLLRDQRGYISHQRLIERPREGGMDGQRVRALEGRQGGRDTQYCPIKRWVPLLILLLSALYAANNWGDTDVARRRCMGIMGARSAAADLHFLLLGNRKISCRSP